MEGRFHRAINIAERVGIRQQKLHVFYNFAWTEYWWYEDYETYNRLYDQVEKLVIGSPQADDIELLVNLWQILHTAEKRGLITKEEADLPIRTQTVKLELNRLISDERRPNNALQAQTNRLFIDLTEAFPEEKSINLILEKFKDVLKRSEGLSEYPISSTIKIIQELGDNFPDSPKFDELLEVVVEVTGRRTSQGKAGQILLERGKQKLRAGKNYDAIKLIGRAQQKLAMDEYRSEWVTSLVLCSQAYEAVGLLWAARANFLLATNLVFSEYIKDGKIDTTTLRFTQKLVWLELQLGRLPHILSWIEFASIVANLMVFNDDNKEKLQDELAMQDKVLAILLIKTEFWKLKWLDLLPSVLDRMDLFSSWMTLLYILGYEDLLREEKVIPVEESPETIQELFCRLNDQPASNDLPGHPELMNASTVELVSPVLGCTVIINATNHQKILFLAENIIGALEAFLATSFDSDIMPYRSELHINIRSSDFLTGLPDYSINEKKQGEIEIRCPTEILKSNSEERAAYSDWLQKIILDITFQIAIIPDPESFVDQVVKDEQSFNRAIMFSDVEIAITNLLGEKPKIHLSDWENGEVMEKYPLRREVPWDFNLKKQGNSDNKKTPFKFAEDDPPESLFDMDNVKHKDRKIISLIDIPLWDQAKWQAIGYICAEGAVPILALVFKNPNPANQIFVEWREILGEVDKENKLRISIITGVSKEHPLNYKVIISTNMEKFDLGNFNHFIFTVRFIEMFPQTSNHLDYLLTAYKKVGRFTLVPAKANAELNYPVSIGKHWLGKDNLIVRPAWQIGSNDPDVAAIQEGDDPIIPESEMNPPVLRALNRFSKRKRKKRH